MPGLKLEFQTDSKPPSKCEKLHQARVDVFALPKPQLLMEGVRQENTLNRMNLFLKYQYFHAPKFLLETFSIFIIMNESISKQPPFR